MRKTIVVCLAVAIAMLTATTFAENPPDVTLQPDTSTCGTTSSGITISFAEMPVEIVASRVSSATGKSIIARGKTLGQRVNIIVRDVPLERVLDAIVNQKPNWLWQAVPDKPNTYEIWDQESFRREVLPKQVVQRIYRPEHITAEEAFKAVQGTLTPNIGLASFDPRTNKLIVTDLPSVLELIQRLLEQIDVSFDTKVFRMKYADVNEMANHLSTLKSPAAPVPIVDERTRQIIVQDRADAIRKMEKVVQILDIETSDTEPFARRHSMPSRPPMPPPMVAPQNAPR